VAVLAPDQSLALSTPNEAGTPPDAVEIMRRADTVLVHNTPSKGTALATGADLILDAGRAPEDQP
jgi:hypothetical protein